MKIDSTDNDDNSVWIKVNDADIECYYQCSEKDCIEDCVISPEFAHSYPLPRCPRCDEVMEYQYTLLRRVK